MLCRASDRQRFSNVTPVHASLLFNGDLGCSWWILERFGELLWESWQVIEELWGTLWEVLRGLTGKFVIHH